jgi:adenylate cyclase, class 2
MAMSRRETEIKLAFPSPQDARRALALAGATESRPREFEDNLLFDLDDRRLESAGRLLRLRRAGARAVVTYKGPAESGHRYKIREEAEVSVADGEEMDRILRGVGFRPGYRYQKYRTSFELEGVAIALDETALGTFVELEGEPDAIDRVAAALGKGPRDYLRTTYRELQEQDAAARGVTAGDLLYPRDPA